MSCTCDFTLPELFTACNGCAIYDGFTISTYSILFLYTLAVFLYYLFEKVTLNTRNIVLFLLLLVSILRILRFSILAGLSNPFVPPESHLLIFLDVLYGLPLMIGFACWNLISFSWLRMYWAMKNPSTAKSKSSGSLFSWRWLVLYTAVCLVIGIAWLVVIFVASYVPTNFLLNGYSAACAASMGVFFLTVGCLFTNHLKVSVTINPSRQSLWKRVNTFIAIISICFLVDVIVLIGISSVTSFVLQNDFNWFLIRNAIYRGVEQIPIYAMVTLFKPPWKNYLTLFTKKFKKQTQTQESNITTATTTV